MSTDLAELFRRGWLTLPISRLSFPARCCRCGEATSNTSGFSGEQGLTVLGALASLGGVERKITVQVPLCAGCQGRRRRRKARGAALGLLIGASLAALGAATPTLVGASGGSTALQGVVVAVGALLGAYAGWLRLGGREPVRLRRLSVADGTVELWFERPEYREQVAALQGGAPAARER